MDKPIHTEDRNGYRIEIHLDKDPQNPRDWDNLGTMICKHKRYELGDVKESKTFDLDNHNGFIADVINCGGVVLILWLYDHSGIAIRSSEVGSDNPFNCRWDSGSVGFIYVTVDMIGKEYGLDKSGKIPSAGAYEKAKAQLEQEVKTYDHYLQGQCYGFRVMEEDEEKDSCWGFYQNELPSCGDDGCVLGEARDIADSLPEISTKINTMTVEVDGSEYVFKSEDRKISRALSLLVEKLGEPIQEKV